MDNTYSSSSSPPPPPTPLPPPSSSFLLGKYDVFLSFRGEDTRESFTSHLYEALCRKKLETYIDYKLERGDEISSALVKAIQGSRISIIIFSQNYASSPWCLDELLHILRSKEKQGQLVVPVFYHIDPSYVRKQQGSYAIALSVLEERFKKKIVDQWRNALTAAANLSGWDSLVTRPESKLVEAIVEDVLKKLNYISPFDDFKGLVGVDKRIEEIISLLQMGSLDVRVVGIWGMGGIGKTTLASVVFNRLASQFEGCCFLENVREESEKRGLNHLRNTFFSKLLEEENLDLGPLCVGTTFIKNRLRRKKVLIVLDDVSDSDQLEPFVGDHSWFGVGSRIIVTTRDMQMLRNEADEIYMVERLNFGDALQLFHSNAFRRSAPTIDDIELSKRVVKYAEGVPLALKVLGSFLRGKRKENWECELDKLKVVPNTKIQNVLRVSFEGLDKKEKNIFLDIACFFKGMDRHYVEKILDACGFFAKIGIDDLIDKSLIIIKDRNILWMHDLIQEMGWEIVRSIEELRKRSRLWIAQDIYHVFKHTKGTGAIEGIFLNMSEYRDVHFSPKVFEEMHNLRLLKVYYSSHINKFKVYLPLSLQFLPNSLRYLDWCECPLKSLPSSFAPRNLVEIDMRYSQLERLWDEVQDLVNLRHIDLGHSKYLTQVPDLSRAPNLESVNLEHCTSLLHVPSLRFKLLDNFSTCLDTSYCEDRCCLKGSDNPRALGTVNLKGCSNLKSLSRNVGNMKYLHLSNTAIEKLPSSVWCPNNLVSLNLNNCLWLKNLPPSSTKLVSLHELNLSGCSSLCKFPELPKNIRHLYLRETGIEEVPSSIMHLSHLKSFHLDNCKKLKSLSPSICKLKSLSRFHLDGCTELENFPEISEPMEFLEWLDLHETGVRKLPFSIENMVGLCSLTLSSCKNLEFVPSSIYNINHLQSIFLSNCSKLENFPPMSDLCHLAYLDFSYCNILEIPDSLGYLSSVKTLDLRGNFFGSIPASIKQLSKLKVLKLSDCKNLQSLPELPLSLESLNASGCELLEDVSHSRTEFTLGNIDYNVVHSWVFLFYCCPKLDQHARDNTMTEFQSRVLQTSTISVSKPEELEDSEVLKRLEDLGVSVCLPGMEIPKWFSHQSEKSSINIELSPHWHRTNFLGFALCAVVAFGDYHCNFDYLNFYCELHFKTNHGKTHTLSWSFPNWENGELEQSERTMFSSEHVFMWYKPDSYCNCLDAVEVSFEFLLRNDRGQLLDSDDCKVKKCGVRQLYRQDVEELHFANSQSEFGQADTTFDKPEPISRTWKFDHEMEEQKGVDQQNSNGTVHTITGEGQDDEQSESEKREIECQGTGTIIDGVDEKPTVPLSKMFKYKIKVSDARRAWMKSPEVLENCSTGFHFPSQSEETIQEKVKPLKFLRFYGAH